MSDESKIVREQPRRLASLEDSLIQWLSRVLPLGVLKRLPTLYYRINRYRFRLVSRPAMAKETSKARARRIAEGFFDRYFKGRGLDVGYGGDLVVPNCRGWDVEQGNFLRGIRFSSRFIMPAGLRPRSPIDPRPSALSNA